MVRWLYRVAWISTANTEDFARVPYPILGIPTAGEVLQKTLSELGNDGWEFTGLIPADTPMCYHALFKKQDEPEREDSSVRKSIRRNIAKQSRRK
jgi:hypothetical protein